MCAVALTVRLRDAEPVGVPSSRWFVSEKGVDWEISVVRALARAE